MTASPVGILGGTFNPIHYGHLRSALELRESLGLGEVRLMPAALPPHRDAPGCPAELRANMVSLAIAGEPGLVCDRRELGREGPSYTVDSLREIRAELGDEVGLCLIVGADALSSLSTWSRWEEIPQLAHILALARPGWELPQTGLVADWLRPYLTDSVTDMRQYPCGKVLLQRMRPLDISSTEIRRIISRGLSPRYLLPDSVWEQIKAAGLYGYKGDTRE